LTTSVDTLLAIHKAVSSPWLGINLDTGNYPGDPYAGIAALAPHASIARILRENGFGGWVSLEMEGKEPADTAVPKSLALLREAFA
jgi:sugar phosphate isomerase/epimerase